MANSVLAQIVRKNSYDYECIHQESILCEKARSEGFYWRIPLVRAGVLVGYTFRKSETKPTPDSMLTIRVTDGGSGIVYFVAVADNASAEVFNEACNACCDGDTELDTVAMPTILIEEEGCIDAEGNYNYFAIVNTPPEADEVYILSGSVNNVALPAAPAEGFASLAALAVWADANWATGDLDGVTIDGGKVTLHAGPSGVSGVINVQKVSFFESNAPGALDPGENYVLNATINGNVLPAINGVDDAALSTIATAANADADYAFYGTWSVVAGKVRLVGKDVALDSAALVVTIV